MTVGRGITWQIPSSITLINEGRLSVEGSIENDGTFIDQPAADANGDAVPGTGLLGISGRLLNTDQLIAQHGGILSVSDGGVLTNQLTIELHTGAHLAVQPGAVVENAGFIRLDASTDLSSAGDIKNTGTIYNSGTITTNLSADAQYENGDAASIVNQDGGTTNGRDGTITTSLSTPVTVLDAASCAGLPGTWTAATRTCLIANGTHVTIPASEILLVHPGDMLESFGRLQIAGRLEIAGTFQNTTYGTVTIGVQTLVGGAASLDVDANAALLNYGIIAVEQPDARLHNLGTLTNGAGSSIQNFGLTDNAQTINNLGAIDNFGTFTNDLDLHNLCGGTVSTENGGVFNGHPPIADGCSAGSPLAPVVVALASNLNPSAVGHEVTFTATLLPFEATGTVTFFDGATSLGQATLVNATATLVTTALPVGTRSITAAYSGDTTYAPSTSAPLTQVVTAAADYPQALAVGDFNGDGLPDLAVAAASTGQNSVTVFQGLGDGTFVLSGTYAAGKSPTSLVTADFNGDGFADLVVGGSEIFNGGNTYSVLLGNGDGTFRNAVSGNNNIAFGSAAYQGASLAAADFNHDGRIDLAVGADETGHVAVMAGNGDGTFQPAVGLTGDPNAMAAASILAIDLNQDGNPDLIGNQTIGDARLFAALGNGDGTFQPAASYGPPIDGNPTALATGDLNHDGFPDVVVGYGTSSGIVGIRLGGSDGTLLSEQRVRITGDVAAGSVQAVRVADVNQDGFLDVIVACDGTNTVDVLLGNGDGTLQTARTFPVGDRPYALVTADFNGNGLPDLVTANLGSADLSLLLDPIGPPDLTAAVSHTGNFVQGQHGASYLVTVANTGHEPTSGTVQLVDMLPPGVTLTAIGGNGWSCDPATASCQRDDALAPGAAYPAIVATVDIAPDAPVSVTNQVAVSGGGQARTDNDTATDSAAVAQTPVLTVVANDALRLYGSPNPTLSGTISGLVAGDNITVTYTTEATDASAAGTYPIVPTLVDPDGKLAGYRVVVTNATLTVLREPLLVTADSLATTFGTPTPAFTVQYTGFVLGQTVASLTGSLSFSGSATTAADAGTYTITPGGLTSTNYQIVFLSGTLSINHARPVVTWPAPAAIIYGTALGATQLNATASVAGAFTYEPAAGTVLDAGSGQTLTATFVPTDPNYETTATRVSIDVGVQPVTISWPTPAAITYGTALGDAQLDATADAAGAFTYTPAAGTVLDAGPAQTLSVTFTPADPRNHPAATATVLLDVAPRTPILAWPAPSQITYGQPLDERLLDATADVPGTFTYVPAAGTILDVGDGQTVTATFTPTDSTNYTTATQTLALDVVPAASSVSWPARPAAITYGTPIGPLQLDAVANVPGTFVYTPPAGTVLNAGLTQRLSVTFTPTDPNYTPSSTSTTIDVRQAASVISWPTPAPVGYGTPLGSAQLNATANVAGTFTYTPPAGTILGTGSGQILSVAFTPANPNYAPATATTIISVLKPAVTLAWATPAPIVYGTALGPTQLNATANVPGTFAYLPPAGTVLPVGTSTLSVVFTPADPGDFGPATASVTVTVLNAVSRFTGDGSVQDDRVERHFTFTLDTTPHGVRGALQYDRLELDRHDDHRGRHDDHRQARKDRFEVRSITTAAVATVPATGSGGDHDRPRGPQWIWHKGPDDRKPVEVNAVTFSGTGRWNGVDGYAFEASAFDASSQGRDRDHFSLTIRDASGTVVDTFDVDLPAGSIHSLLILTSNHDRDRKDHGRDDDHGHDKGHPFDHDRKPNHDHGPDYDHGRDHPHKGGHGNR
jgi:hypothetical protein